VFEKLTFLNTFGIPATRHSLDVFQFRFRAEPLFRESQDFPDHGWFTDIDDPDVHWELAASWTVNDEGLTKRTIILERFIILSLGETFDSLDTIPFTLILADCAILLVPIEFGS
jgi:hypothetical protein